MNTRVRIQFLDGQPVPVLEWKTYCAMGMSFLDLLRELDRRGLDTVYFPLITDCRHISPQLRALIFALDEMDVAVGFPDAAAPTLHHLWHVA